MEQTQRSQLLVESTGDWEQQSEPYLVDGLPHEVFLHGDVVANELLHGAAQQTVIEELIQVYLMLYKQTKENHQEGPSARKQFHLAHLLPVSRTLTDTCLQSPALE